MSDFSELCPLFNTGVYNEVSFHNISMTAIAPTHNALVGARGLATSPASFKFGRTVIVTKVYQRCDTRPSTKHTILAVKQKSTGTAALTAYASLLSSVTIAKSQAQGRYRAMTQAANKTFLAADVLGFSSKTTIATKAGYYSFIVRYKDK
jgi:hypothetical protein